ncbi:MAG: hypothetical protein IKI83_04395 [Prevotella sp.]|nr:hypothetical protein [Prevotella sp.]
MQQTEYPAVGRGHEEPYRLPTAGFFSSQPFYQPFRSTKQQTCMAGY